MTSPRGTALVTGAGRRIGAAVADALHEAGMNVVLHHHSSGAAALELVETLNTRRNRSAIAVSRDLLQVEGLDDLVQRALESFGGLQLLINNASSFFPTPVGTTTPEQWDNLVGTNLRAPFFLAQAATEALRASGGSVINMVDVYGERPLAGHCVYSTAKAGLVMLTKSLALELAPDVRVNAIAPGAILWPEGNDAESPSAILPRVPMGRSGDVRDIADAVLYLAFRSNYMTGQILTVDGGRTLHM